MVERLTSGGRLKCFVSDLCYVNSCVKILHYIGSIMV